MTPSNQQRQPLQASADIYPEKFPLKDPSNNGNQLSLDPNTHQHSN